MECDLVECNCTTLFRQGSLERLPLSISLQELYFVNVVLLVEEEMCHRFLNGNHKNFRKDSVVLHDRAGTTNNL
jgi:hypothetical protein